MSETPQPPADAQPPISAGPVPGPPPAQPPGPSPGPDDFERLHPRVKWLWRFQAVVTLGVLGALGATAGLVAFFQEALPPRTVLAIVLGVFGFLALLLLAWPSLSYRAWGHRLDERVFETRQGVLFRVRQLVPVNRIQHVDLRSGPLERTLGLSSLVVYTAGAQAATVQLPGLDPTKARALRDHLIEVGGDDGV